MKNTLKHIAMAAIPAALLMLGYTAAAQNLPEGTYKVVNGIAFNKSATDNHDGTFTIDLESFVTGEKVIKYQSIPADIVLVLDVSGSMLKAVSGTSSYVSNISYEAVRVGRQVGYESLSNSSGYSYSVLVNGSSYTPAAYRESIGGSYRYFVRVLVGSSYYYLGPNGPVQYANASSVPGGYYTSTATGRITVPDGVISRQKSRMEVLQSAALSFVEAIDDNDKNDPATGNPRVDQYGNQIRLGNRISIVTFPDLTKNAKELIGYSGNITPAITEQYYLMSNAEEQAALTPLTEKSSLESIINGLTYKMGGTRAEKGVEMAKTIMLRDGREDANRTVVLFTDGVPGNADSENWSSGTSAQNTSEYVANAAIAQAYQLKHQTKNGNDFSSTVWTVGFFEGLSSTDLTNATNYLAYVSSDYPNAQSMSNYGTAGEETGHAQNVGAMDLQAIFEAIASSSGGEAIQLSSESVVTVDVVSDAFEIPSNATPPQVLIAPLTGQSGEPYTGTDGARYVRYTFGQEKAPSEYLPAAEAGGISLSRDPENPKKVSTTGFKYSDHWCGRDDDSPTGFHQEGYKLILRFTVTPSESAVGGPETSTNTEESGIYVNGEKIATFNQPTVQIPVALWIKKEGLKDNDSAVFTIYYADPTTSENEGKNPHNMRYQSFTKVVVNNSCEAEIDGQTVKGVVKLVGLDSKFHYRIREDAWTWSYDKLPDQYTCDLVANPVVFVNTPKENAKQGEDVVRNVFDPTN